MKPCSECEKYKVCPVEVQRYSPFCHASVHGKQPFIPYYLLGVKFSGKNKGDKND